MLLVEIFDSPYTLITNNLTAEIVKNIRSEFGVTRLQVFVAKEDPTQVMLLLYHDGAWEVHHAKIYEIDGNYRFVSGETVNDKAGPNPRFISTAIHLLKEKLSRGQAVRIVAANGSGLWKTYERVIGKFVSNKDAFVLEPVNHEYTGYDGTSATAQVIRPRGSLWAESLVIPVTPTK